MVAFVVFRVLEEVRGFGGRIFGMIIMMCSRLRKSVYRATSLDQQYASQ
jgi:hypothetical protein